MFSWPWWVFSVIAAVLWGLHFNLIVKVSHVLPRDIYAPLTIFTITSSAMLLIWLTSFNKIASNILTLWQAGTEIRISVIVLVCTALVASSLLYLAMSLSPNATLAALLDIMYPVFVAIVAWLLYREIHIDWSVLVGGGLIFAGAMIIIWKHG